ncbi:TBC1 domain family member 13-like [Lingula anatina]|uniref:TBC1 domain family member 13-like n=1 Tax=Lingula anatina TaxID=7574 RepID=A0A1S3HY82_LINAN|nr:TBC1 domain family member 13-like [Lingula anatina]|eukprot:XP_013390968.2 TBC1 domain family member 13-like [Lingula anatina]
MAAYRLRVDEFKKILEADIIDTFKLRQFCFNGCPHEDGIRATCWKILLHYLPPNRKQWPELLEKQREIYRHFIDEMIVQPGATASKSDQRMDVTFEDHPLNPNPDSQWVTYFKDNEMLLQIDRDCRRLCPDFVFFQRATEYPCKELTQTSGVETLRKRVEQTALKAETVSKNRLGITLSNSVSKEAFSCAVAKMPKTFNFKQHGDKEIRIAKRWQLETFDALTEILADLQ